MKSVTAFVLAILFALSAVMTVAAQTADSIWLTADVTSYQTKETVTVNVNATSATPIQGFTFQIRYDPACLKPINASSPIPGMNGLPLPQTSGLVDASYASTMPQTVNGVLAEVRFITLKGCQTDLTLESAALAIRNEAGFAAPLAGVAIGAKNVALNIDKAVAASQPDQSQPVTGLPLEPTIVPSSSWQIFYIWISGLLIFLFVIGAAFVLYKRSQNGTVTAKKIPTSSRSAALHFKHGPYAGKSFILNRLPCMIGRDTLNDICINDPSIISHHAKIFAASNGYYLMDLGGTTFVNGHAVRRSSVVLRPGDVVRLGRSALFVFGLQ